MKNKIILVAGDPNSINSEIILKCWQKLKNEIKKKIYLIGSHELIIKQALKLNYAVNTIKVSDIDQDIKKKGLKIINIDLKFKNPFLVSNKFSSIYVKKSLNLAHKLCLRKDVQGMINCSINKRLLGEKNTGVTEFLARKCNMKSKAEVMLINNKKLSVCPLTTHINLKQVTAEINKKLIVNKIKTINSWFIDRLKKKPKFGILGLNPHNGELRANSEEIKIIIPSINDLKRLGIKIDGPLVPDTLFINEFKKYDVIIGMYHDQVLIPFKTLFKFDAINITLGLKYLRVSPDHGTAVNLIGKHKANPESLLRCINFIQKFKK